MPYADRDQLIADLLPKNTSAAEKDAIGRLLDGVSAFVDTYCDRPAGFFDPSPEGATMKRVRGEGKHYLRLPLHVFGSIESVTLYDEEIDSAEFYESEKNGWLYYENIGLGLENTFRDCLRGDWYRGEIYKVTARWGHAATPNDLQEAVRQTVTRLREVQKGTFGQITPSGFVIERALPLFAREVLDRHKRRQFEIP
jgi:hypothetical protein